MQVTGDKYLQMCQNCLVPMLDGYGVEYGDKVVLTLLVHRARSLPVICQLIYYSVRIVSCLPCFNRSWEMNQPSIFWPS